jgi:hypothetical protein
MYGMDTKQTASTFGIHCTDDSHDEKRQLETVMADGTGHKPHTIKEPIKQQEHRDGPVHA